MSLWVKYFRSLEARRIELMGEAFGNTPLPYEKYLETHARVLQIAEDVTHARKLSKGEEDEGAGNST